MLWRRKNKLLLLLGIAGMILAPLLLLFCLQTTQYLLKVSAAARLEGRRQQTIVLHKDAVRWEEPGRELKIGGRFFDASKVTYSGNYIAVTGHFDDMETAVAQLLEKAVHHSTNAGLFNRILLLLQCVVAIPILALLLTPLNAWLTHRMRPVCLYKNPFSNTNALPPWLPLSQA
ncbi:hypothetical protein [Pseudocnuella soli]|uniref:hypothetical protein n=1 Tax=Pseudocnuella soli TaxID=2502779 RepID=UPI0010497A07|nr:hypothetical protein [Pseudocnuella soli]